MGRITGTRGMVMWQKFPPSHGDHRKPPLAGYPNWDAQWENSEKKDNARKWHTNSASDLVIFQVQCDVRRVLKKMYPDEELMS